MGRTTHDTFRCNGAMRYVSDESTHNDRMIRLTLAITSPDSRSGQVHHLRPSRPYCSEERSQVCCPMSHCAGVRAFGEGISIQRAVGAWSSPFISTVVVGLVAANIQRPVRGMARRAPARARARTSANAPQTRQHHQFAPKPPSPDAGATSTRASSTTKIRWTSLLAGNTHNS